MSVGWRIVNGGMKGGGGEGGGGSVKVCWLKGTEIVWRAGKGKRGKEKERKRKRERKSEAKKQRSLRSGRNAV